MTMIETVQCRQRGAYEFGSYYENQCILQSSCPLPSVKAQLHRQVVNLNADRVRTPDWEPIFSTLKINRSLEYVGVRSYYSERQQGEGKQSSGHQRIPAIRCADVLQGLCQSLKDCLTVTPALKSVELHGLFLKPNHVRILSWGLSESKSLSYVSLAYSRIGDSGVDILCQGIKNASTITHIDLTGCGLTRRGAEALSKIVKHQSMMRFSEAWQDSLRYRRPDLDRMAGIRRLTLNGNPLVGDRGAEAFGDALKDDIWLKALDLQHCGVSNTGAGMLLDVLKYNTTIVVVDIRKNQLVDQDVVRSVMEQCLINSHGNDDDYPWTKMKPKEEPNSRQRVRYCTKVIPSSFRKRTSVKVTRSSRRRSGGGSVVQRQIRKNSAGGDITPGAPGWVPWRTAARAKREDGYPVPRSRPDAGSRSGRRVRPKSDSMVTVTTVPGEDDDDDDDDDDDEEELLSREREQRGRMDEMSYNIREMRIEVEEGKLRLQDEMSARLRADSRCVELELENKRLREQLRRQNMSSTDHLQSILEDDGVIETIESTFKKFTNFLDLLSNAGLGDLAKLANIERTELRLFEGKGKPTSDTQNNKRHSYHPPSQRYPENDFKENIRNKSPNIKSYPSSSSQGFINNKRGNSDFQLPSTSPPPKSDPVFRKALLDELEEITNSNRSKKDYSGSFDTSQDSLPVRDSEPRRDFPSSRLAAPSGLVDTEKKDSRKTSPRQDSVVSDQDLDREATGLVILGVDDDRFGVNLSSEAASDKISVLSDSKGGESPQLNLSEVGGSAYGGLESLESSDEF